FFRRLEVAWPILDPSLRTRLEQQILGISLADDMKSWRLHPDGTWRRRKPSSSHPVRSQQRFIDIARAEAVKLAGPYEEAVKKAGVVRKKGKRRN
ncbi:MAG TPA: hypothetical protein VFO89_07945, partial [Thermoanaerobaculia bacterium]|nr:hypothetical protein [Thermoanaerobaculia bacterium]